MTDDRASDAWRRIDGLLKEIWQRRYDDPQAMVRFAEETVGAIEGIDPAMCGELVLADLRARATTELGNAYRIADHLSRAEATFENALWWWRRGTRDPRLLTKLAEYKAALHCHRREFKPALELLEHACKFWRAWGDDQAAGRTYVTAGLYTWYSGAPRQALLMLCEALELIDAEREPQLALAAIHNLLCVLTDLGWFRQAERLVLLARSLYEGAGWLNTLRRRWLEAAIAGGLGRFSEAERLYKEVRDGFLSSQLLFPAAMVSLDWALVWLLEGRYQEIEQMARELIEVFRGLEVPRDMIAALILLRRACRQGVRQRASTHLLHAIRLLRAHVSA